MHSKLILGRRVLGAATIAVATLLVVGSAHAQEDAAEAPETETVELANGDTVQVIVVERTETGIIADHPVFGRIEIPNDQIKVEEPEPIKRGFFGTPFLRGWDRSVSFGFNGSSGNSDAIGINTGFETSGKGSWYRGRFRARYFYANQRTVEQALRRDTTNNAFVDYRHDFLLFGEDSPFFLWGNARYDYDAFQDFNHRIAAQGGAGYDIVKNAKIELATNLGAGVNYSTNRPNRPTPFPAATKGELVIGVDFLWNIMEGQKLVADTYYYPNLEDFGNDFRILSSLVYEISLGWVEGLALNAGLKNEYRNQVTAPQPPQLRNEKNNLQYYGGLTYNF